MVYKMLTPQERIKKVNEVQYQAVKSWIDSGGNSTLKLATGTGKNFVAFKCVYAALKLDWINKGDTIRFWAETEVREKTFFEDEAPKFKELYGDDYDIVNDFNCIFSCYQAGLQDSYWESKLDVKIEIYDEIDFALTPVFSKVIEDSNAPYRIGLTATNSDNATVMTSVVSESLHGKVRQTDIDTEAGNITDFINKGQLLEVLCPISYEYPLEQAIKDGILSGYETYIINHSLDNIVPYIPKSKSNPDNIFYTEQQFYSRKRWMLSQKFITSIVKGIAGRAMAKTLYELKSKANLTRALLKCIDPNKKILIYGVRKNLLKQITENVCEKDNVTELINQFNKGEINVIASSKYLQRGISLNNPEVLIIVSYYSTSRELEQILGRMVRYSYGSIKKIFIIKTIGTLEDKWFSNMTKIHDDNNKVVREIDLNIVRQFSTNEILNKARKLMKS